MADERQQCKPAKNHRNPLLLYWPLRRTPTGFVAAPPQCCKPVKQHQFPTLRSVLPFKRLTACRQPLPYGETKLRQPPTAASNNRPQPKLQQPHPLRLSPLSSLFSSSAAIMQNAVQNTLQTSTRAINAVVTSAGLMQKTVKVRIGTQKWNKKVRKVCTTLPLLLPNASRTSLLNLSSFRASCATSTGRAKNGEKTARNTRKE